MRKHSVSAMPVRLAAIVKISVLIILVVRLASCVPVLNHGYYAPSAATGSLEKYPYGSQCSGPKRVIRFPLIEESNIALTVYAFGEPVPGQPRIKVYIEATYFSHNKINSPSHVFHASTDQIAIYWGNGEHRVFLSALSTKDRVLDSKYQVSTLALLTLPQRRLSNFTVEIPPVFFDGHKLEIPQVHFEYKTTSYISAINC